VDQRRKRSDHPGNALGGCKERSACIAAPQTQLEGIASGSDRDSLTIDVSDLGLHAFDVRIRLSQQGESRLVFGIEAEFALVKSDDVDFDALEFALGDDAALARILHLVCEPCDFGLARRNR
jgi:hypothetical protein